MTGGPPKKDVYDSFSDWYEDELRWMYERSLDKTVLWCPEWRLHSEALVRVRYLWRAREAAHRTDTEAAWLANLADPIMRDLLSPDGTFRGCTVEKGHDQRNFPLPGIP